MELRNFVMPGQQPLPQAPYWPGLSKEGKALAGKAPPPEPEIYLPKWGLWADGGGYADGRAVGTGSLGIDYRIAPNWLVGVYGQVYGARRFSGQGGLYTTFWRNGFYGALSGGAGPNLYTVTGQVGYAFPFCGTLTGPVYAFQYDNIRSTDFGFGLGALFQNRVGWWLAYPWGRIMPQVQAMWQYSSVDEDPVRRNAAWLGAGVAFGLTDTWSAYSWYDFEGNSNYQISQWSLGLRYSF